VAKRSGRKEKGGKKESDKRERQGPRKVLKKNCGRGAMQVGSTVRRVKNREGGGGGWKSLWGSVKRKLRASNCGSGQLDQVLSLKVAWKARSSREGRDAATQHQER